MNGIFKKLFPPPHQMISWSTRNVSHRCNKWMNTIGRPNDNHETITNGPQLIIRRNNNGSNKSSLAPIFPIFKKIWIQFEIWNYFEIFKEFVQSTGPMMVWGGNDFLMTFSSHGNGTAKLGGRARCTSRRNWLIANQLTLMFFQPKKKLFGSCNV